MSKRIFQRCFYILISLMGLFILPTTASAEDYYEQHAVGWHWYDDPHVEKSSQEISQDPVKQMKAVKQALEQALDQAVLNPTPQNVKNYIVLQNQMSDRASHFSHIWQLVLLQNPRLNYSIEHPTNQVGREVYLDEQRMKEDAAIRKLSQHSGLFFFYRSSCPYCQRFAPIVKDFSQRYGIAVIPITTDGIALPSFPDSRVDQGQAEKFHVSVEPALFTVNPYTHQAIPVSYGLTTEDELRSRILEIATNFKRDNE